MSDDAHWSEILRSIEKELGRPLSADERERFDQLRPEIERVSAEFKNKLEANLEAHEKNPLVAFLRKLMARQGTIAPDFDSLYAKKAELDRKLLGSDDA